MINLESLKDVVEMNVLQRDIERIVGILGNPACNLYELVVARAFNSVNINNSTLIAKAPLMHIPHSVVNNHLSGIYIDIGHELAVSVASQQCRQAHGAVILPVALEHPVDIGIHSIINGIGSKVKCYVTLLVGEDGLRIHHHIVRLRFLANVQLCALDNLVALLQIRQVQVNREFFFPLVEKSVDCSLVNELHR